MLNSLLEQVKQAIFNSPQTPHGPNNDPDGLIGKITDLFGQQRGGGQGGFGNVRPASEDPLGDPADAYGAGQGGSGYPNVRPASEDPLGDPGVQYGGASGGVGGVAGGFPNVRPASEDPLGDPTDQGR